MAAFSVHLAPTPRATGQTRLKTPRIRLISQSGACHSDSLTQAGERYRLCSSVRHQSALGRQGKRSGRRLGDGRRIARGVAQWERVSTRTSCMRKLMLVRIQPRAQSPGKIPHPISCTWSKHPRIGLRMFRLVPPLYTFSQVTSAQRAAQRNREKDRRNDRQRAKHRACLQGL